MLLQKLTARISPAFGWIRLRLFMQSRSMMFGTGCSIATGVRVRATDGARAIFGSGVSIDRYADITAKFGDLAIGDGTYIGQFAVICAREKITIGPDCLIAEHVTVRDQDHGFGVGLKTITAGFTTAPVEIGQNVWIGAKTTITKGVKIGDNSVVGANSVVTGDVPPNTIVAGAPACVLRAIR